MRSNRSRFGWRSRSGLGLVRVPNNGLVAQPNDLVHQSSHSVSLDGVGDKVGGDIGTIDAGSTMTLLAKSSTDSVFYWSGGSTGLTANDTWQVLTIPISGDQSGFELGENGANSFAGSIADVKINGGVDGFWLMGSHKSGTLTRLLEFDRSGNGNHLTYTGCTANTGEGPDSNGAQPPPTGLMDWNTSAGPVYATEISVKTDKAGVTGSTQIQLLGHTLGTYDCTIDWGDGSSTYCNTQAVFQTLHDYGVAGTYNITITGEFPGFDWNNSAEGNKLVGDVAIGAVEILERAFYGVGATGNFSAKFPTSNITSFSATWFRSDFTGVFPLLDTSNVTNFNAAWFRSQFTGAFPLLDTSNVTNFSNAWRESQFTGSFPLLDVSNVTNFNAAWSRSEFTEYPSNFFDSWTAVPSNNCFVDSWDSMPNLTATSVENILNSIDTSGQSAPASGVDITIDYDVGTGSPNASTAITNLKARGWTITLNGVAQ